MKNVSFLFLFLSLLISCNSFYLKRAIKYQDTEDFIKAIDYYSRYLKHKQDPYIYFFRSLAYYRIEEYDSTIKDLLMADTLLNDNTYEYFGKKTMDDTTKKTYVEYKNAIYNNLGDAYYKLSRFRQAIYYFKKSYAIKPFSKEINYNLGISYYDLGVNDSAYFFLRKQIELENEHYKSYFILALILDAYGYPEKAIQICKKGIALKYDPTALYNIGLFYNRTEQSDSAIYYLSKSIELDSAFPLAYLERGKAYGMKGMYKNAINDCTIGIKLDSTISDFYYILGMAYSERNIMDSACYYFHKEKKYSPDSDIFIQFPECLK